MGFNRPSHYSKTRIFLLYLSSHAAFVIKFNNISKFGKKIINKILTKHSEILFMLDFMYCYDLKFILVNKTSKVWYNPPVFPCWQSSRNWPEYPTMYTIHTLLYYGNKCPSIFRHYVIIVMRMIDNTVIIKHLKEFP